MSSTSPAPSARPRQATFASVLVMLSGVIVVLTAWETVANLGSIETRESIREVLAEPPWDETGLSLAQARQGIRVAALVAGTGGAAASILAVWCLRRDRAARLGLAVVAVPVVLAGFGIGGFSSTVLGVAAMMLWLQPSRDWFDGKPSRPEGERARGPAAGAVWPPPVRTPTPPDGRSGSGGPRGPDPGWAPPDPATRHDQPGPAGGWPAPTAALAADDRRPVALARACLVTGVFAGGALLVTIIALGVLLAAPDAVLSDLRDQDPAALDQAGLTRAELLAGAYVVLGALGTWSVAALALAVLAFRGRDWARIALVASSVGVALAAIVASFANPAVLLVGLAAVVVVLQLLRPEVTAWFHRRR